MCGKNKTVLMSCVNLKNFDVFKSGLPLACRFDPGTHLTDESEPTLDLPKHGAARACPWLSTALVAGSVRRGREGDRCNQRRI